jgi:hypothetical protein
MRGALFKQSWTFKPRLNIYSRRVTAELAITAGSTTRGRAVHWCHPRAAPEDDAALLALIEQAAMTGVASEKSCAWRRYSEASPCRRNVRSE